MKKKQYKNPSCIILNENIGTAILAASGENKIQGNSITFKSDNMDEADGSFAVAKRYSVWEDEE